MNLCPNCNTEWTKCDEDCCGEVEYCRKCGLEKKEAENRLIEEIKDIIKENEKGRYYMLHNDDLKWLVEQVEKQAEIIKGQQAEIDWLRSLPLSNE